MFLVSTLYKQGCHSKIPMWNILFLLFSPCFDDEPSFGSMVGSLLSFPNFGTKETQEDATPMIITPLSPAFGSTSPPCFTRINSFPLGPATLPSSIFSLPYHSELKAIAGQNNQLTSNCYCSIHSLFCPTVISWLPWFAQPVFLP